MYFQTSSCDQSTSGFTLTRLFPSSHSTLCTAVRVTDCSRRRPVIHASSPDKARRSGSILRTPQHSLDRKSTRLNSSHGYISYAVFCLKKKKIHTPLIYTVTLLQ